MKRNYFSSTLGILLSNLLLAYFFLFVCQVIFYLVNIDAFPLFLEKNSLSKIIIGSLRFDTAAVFYLNVLYIVCFLFPFHLKERKAYFLFLKIVYVVSNGIGIIMNLMDTVYFPFTTRRTTATVFSEFQHESNIFKIVSYELFNHWYLTLGAIFLIFIMALLYRRPSQQRRTFIGYYSTNLMLLALMVPICVIGIRGGIGKAIRPITISNANRYVSSPLETAIILNTPFSIIRTIGKKPFKDPKYYSEDSLNKRYNPIVQYNDSLPFQPKNVVVFIIESFGREYIGALNKNSIDKNYKGYTPFTDSLITQSFTFTESYANGKKSIDAMPSILSSIPKFIEPFFVTPASLNDVGGIARSLKKEGYYSAFFHGAPNGSMGFEAFAKAIKYDEYFGMDEYKESNLYQGDKDYDGTWAIWDDPFMQFFCHKMTTFKEPFTTALFTASSHHPFVVPEAYTDKFPKGDLPIHQCIGYVDRALQHFFQEAQRQSWYKNTIFIITSDHTNQTFYPSYKTTYGRFKAPIIFFDPSGKLKGMKDIMAQQIDIMPTILRLLGYKKPFLSFGKDLVHTPKEKSYIVNYTEGNYQYMKNDYILDFNGKTAIHLFNKKKDPFLKNNLIQEKPEIAKQLEDELKPIIQQYMMRMVNNKLLPSP